MMKKFLVTVAWFAGWCPVSASVSSDLPDGTVGNSQVLETVMSPNGETVLKVGLNGDGIPFYNVSYLLKEKKETKTVTVLEDSPLGLETNIGDFTRNLRCVKSETTEKSGEYVLSRSKKDTVRYAGSLLVMTFSNTEGKTMEMEFYVADHDVAYRYRMPMQGETACMVVNREASGFKFPEQTTTFICPQSDVQMGWKRTKPSYEEEYKADAPMDVPSQYGCGYTFPCLFHEGDNGWVLVSETGVTGKYCASHLSDATSDGLYTIAFPMQGENNGFGSTGAQLGLPGVTPWRTLTFGRTLKPIVETTVQFDVVEELYRPSMAYRPGRASWSWIVWQDESMCYDDQIAFIDLAADMGWEYILMDALWDVQVGRDRMEELFRYAHSKGVDVFLWYNSNGGWNDAPQGMKHCMDNPIARKKEMQWLREQGIKGLKVDFFGGDKQETMKLYEAILSDANDYGLQIIFHGCTLPRGWERMYPNYCASEAVLASENIVFQQHFCDEEAFNACLHPFIRNTVGSMDFGGTFLNKRLNRNNNGGTTRRTTDIFELATAVVFQSSVQNFALTPGNLKEQPAFEIDFMKSVPTAWNDVRFLDGYPGKCVALARRSGADWYVAALNAGKEVWTMTVDMPELAGRSLSYYHDGKDGGTPTLETVKADKKGRVRITVHPNGGAMLVAKGE